MKDSAKAIFGVSEANAAGERVVCVGIPADGWEHMKDGKTHTFDLGKVGLPIKLLIFGGKDREACRAMLNTTDATVDMTGVNFGFGLKDK